jgi:dTDP-4-amino-4,6-dideoxygalactose transaminase
MERWWFHIALKVCGVNSFDEVIVPTLTFIAAVNPVKYIGAEPVLWTVMIHLL